MHDGLVGDGTQHATASSQVALLTEGDETLSHRTQALCLGQGGGDALVLEQLRRQVVEHVALVGRGTAEAGTLSGSRHIYFSIVAFPNAPTAEPLRESSLTDPGGTG